MPEPVELLDQLDAAWAEPERTCQWCMARPGEWCEHDCANPERHCHPLYVAQFAADRGAYADRDAALIVDAVNHLPALTSALRAVVRLHVPVEWQECDGDGVPDLDKPLTPFCRECTDDEYVAAIEFGDFIDQGAAVVNYPCPTVSAIASALAHPTNQEGATK